MYVLLAMSLSFQSTSPATTSPKATRQKRSARPTSTSRQVRSSRGVHAVAGQQREQQREGREEEGEVLDRRRGVARVRRLQGVEDDEGGERAREQARRRPGRLVRRVRAQHRGDVRDGRGGHDRVQGQEQVRGRRPDRQRHPEGHGGHDRGHDEAGPPARDHGAHRHRRGEQDRSHERQPGAVAHGCERVGVPDVGQQQQRREDERRRHGERAGPRRRAREHHRDDEREDDGADPLAATERGRRHGDHQTGSGRPVTAAGVYGRRGAHAVAGARVRPSRARVPAVDGARARRRPRHPRRRRRRAAIIGRACAPAPHPRSSSS